jgi:CRISPR-associated endonuclease/helicase Cas3
MTAKEIYKKICGFQPTAEQIEVFEALTNWDTTRNPLLLRLPCGYGKTESVVIPFLTQTITGKWSLAPRMIYVLPTRALCNQIRDRICRYSEKVHELTDKIITVGIEHGISSLDPLFFSDICVTTFDQFLYGYARTKQQIGRHFDLPAGAIANSIVVFDEAHLYSPYTHSLMRAMIEILKASRIPTVIMTATMPKSLQADLLPKIQDHQKSVINFSGNWPESFADRTIKWRQEDWGLLKDEALSDELTDLLAAQKDKRIMIVVNRIDTAQRLARILKENRYDFITLIHSRFTAVDRAEKEKRVCRAYGKRKNEDSKTGIIVSTQVCEVGLDISCDISITECASADALLQRAGRVTRWGGNGEVVIVRPMNNDSWINDDQWNEAFPYVDREKDDESQYGGIKKGEFAGVTWKYLKKDAPRKLFTDWSAMTAFCNMMDYHTDDVEARGALGQLFDSTLYADDRPWNLSARGDLYCTLAVISSDITEVAPISETIRTKKQKKKKKKKDQVAQITYAELRKCCINVPFRYLINKDTTKLRQYDFVEGVAGNELDKARVRPFQTYLIDPSEHYDSHIGLTVARKEKAQDTEEASSCLII